MGRRGLFQSVVASPVTPREKVLIGLFVLACCAFVFTPPRNTRHRAWRPHFWKSNHGAFEQAVLELPTKKPGDTTTVTLSGEDPQRAVTEKITLSDLPSLRCWLWKNFLSAEECEHLIGIARTRLQRSEVVGQNDSDNLVSNVRTSFGMFLQSPEDLADPIYQRFRARMEWATGLPQRNYEATQILHYGLGNQYMAHPDYFALPYEELLKRGGQRQCTFLCYLNNVEGGGATNFPNVNITAQPAQGSCVQFYSTKPDGTVDERSFHAALPVTKGEKWSMPTWIREYEFR
eukprot:TRINITY_DN57479_c0_g1_i1.p1 TRINITY_DN57479_c0_g1~~TRINITY_DN57479_c0_g1_i1.p1  ORF type:complete len:296 (-),score=22.42 TRINITY_DN57479_c0_g1_i1:88-954(-)